MLGNSTRLSLPSRSKNKALVQIIFVNYKPLLHLTHIKDLHNGSICDDDLKGIYV